MFYKNYLKIFNRKFTIYFFLIVCILICSCNILNNDINENDTCLDNVCDAKMVLFYPKDSLGFYHVKLVWGEPYYPRFNLYVEAKKYKTGNLIISARFDTDTYWVLGDSIAFVVPLYNPFTSLYTNPYWNHPLPSRLDTIMLNQFEGLLVPVIQNDTRVYLKEYFPGSMYQQSDEFKPTDPTKYMWSKRIVGPISPSLKNDTATIYMNVNWDELTVDDNVIYSLKVIFE